MSSEQDSVNCDDRPSKCQKMDQSSGKENVVSNSRKLDCEVGSSKSSTKESIIFDVASFERDPGLRIQIWVYPSEQYDEARQAYINDGPYQHILDKDKYPVSGPQSDPHRFQASWFKVFQAWLEYSPSKDAVFFFLALFPT